MKFGGGAARLSLIVACGLFGGLASGRVRAGDLIPPKVITQSPTGIDIATGSATYSHTDLTIGTLSLERFYRYAPTKRVSATTWRAAALFGPGWSNNFDIYVNLFWEPPGKNCTGARVGGHYNATVHIGDTASGLYGVDRTNNFYGNSSDAAKAILSRTSTGVVYTDSAGVIYNLNGVSVRSADDSSLNPLTMRVNSIQYPDGRNRVFTYDSNANLRMITDTTGYAIVFESNGDQIAAACAFDLAITLVNGSTTCAQTPMAVRYNYNSTLISSVTDVVGQTESYLYSKPTGYPLHGQLLPYVTCITPPGYQKCSAAYQYYVYTAYPVVQTMADGGVWQFTWSDLNPAATNTDYTGSCGDYDNEPSFIDPLGNTWRFLYLGATPYSVKDPEGNYTTYIFTGYLNGEYPPPAGSPSSGSTLTQVRQPEGNEYLQESYGPYDAISKQTLMAKPGSNLPNIVVQYKYDFNNYCAQPLGSWQLPPTCTKPISKTDGNGNETDYAYIVSGDIQSEMQPAPTVGAPRPLKLYTYVQKSAYVLNGSGNLVYVAGAGNSLVAVPGPIWTPNTVTECQTVAGGNSPVCDQNGPQKVTTYLYGADGTAHNLLVHGKMESSAGISLVTCYGYDAYSNKISETKPRAGLSQCP